MAKADTDEQTDNGTEERPEDGVEDWPAVHSGRQDSSRLDVPRVIETRDWLAMSIRHCVQLTTEIVHSLTIPQTFTRTLVQRALHAYVHTRKYVCFLDIVLKLVIKPHIHCNHIATAPPDRYILPAAAREGLLGAETYTI